MTVPSTPPGPPGPTALTEDTLVVGYDGTPAASDALALATSLAHLWEVGLHVVTVHHPVVLGGRHAEQDRELAAARCAHDGARRLAAPTPVSWGERREADVAAGLHACAVGSAGLVVGRPHPRVLDREHRRTVLEDAPGPVAVARRALRPHPTLRHVLLALTADGADGALDVLLRFAAPLRRHRGIAVTVCALGPGVASGVLADAAFEIGGAVERRVRTTTTAVRDAAVRWDGDELLVCVGRPRGAHGHAGAAPEQRTLLGQDGPSMMVLPPPAEGAPQTPH